MRALKIPAVLDEGLEREAVGLEPTRLVSRRERHRPGQVGQRSGIDLQGQAALTRQRRRVPDQPEAGHVGRPGDAVAQGGRTRVPVQGGHRTGGGFDRLLGGAARLERGRDDTRPEGLGQDQILPGLAPGVRKDAARLHEAGDRVAELQLGVPNRVSSEKRTACLPELPCTAAHNGRRPLLWKAHVWEGRDRERGQGATAHRIDVRERVGGSDGAKRLRVVDHRGEEVDGLHERLRLVEAEHTRIVARAVVHEDAAVRVRRQCAQDPSELGGTELARSTGAGDHLGQSPDALTLVAHAHLDTPRDSPGQVYKILF